jgi:polysaccharide chain length determinant protein (PEP-CTERM system associated)
MPQSRIYTLEDYLLMVRRRWRILVLSAVAGLLFGYVLVRVLPKQYTSQTLMLIEQQQVPQDYVEPISTEDLNARIANIEEQALSRTGLQPIIMRDGLLKSGASQDAIQGFVLKLQKAVTLTPVEPIVKTANGTIPGFHLAVTLDDPGSAQRACTDIASMFINEDIREQEASAEGTTSFLQAQLEEAKISLNKQDSILANFERKYMGALPDETTTNLSMLGTLNTQLQAVTQDLSRVTQDQAYMQSVLAQQLEAWKLTREIKDGYIPDGNGDSNPLFSMLAAAEGQLATLRANYTNHFPDVSRTEAKIAELKKEIENVSLPSESKQQQTQLASAALEPPGIQKLRGQVRALTETISMDKRQQRRLRHGIRLYESRLRLSPAIEEQYKKITRDHDTALKFYNSLLAKEDQSEMATNLERRQEGDQFRVMDPADLPTEPSFPNPPLFIGGGFAAGLALGLAAIIAIETSDKRIRTERDLQFYLGNVAFALIPFIETAALRRITVGNGTRRKRNLLEVWRGRESD